MSSGMSVVAVKRLYGFRSACGRWIEDVPTNNRVLALR